MERLPPTDPADLQALRAVGWIDGDTVVAGHLLDRLRLGPDPVGAMLRLGDIARAHPDLARAALEDEPMAERLVALVGGSRARSAAVVRAADPQRFIEPDLATLRQQFKRVLSEMAGEDVEIKEVLIPSIVPNMVE